MHLKVASSTLFAAVLLAAGTAGAADPKPEFNNCGKFAKDAPTDATDTVAGNIPEAEIVNAWLQHDASKGAEASTLNITIKNLTGAVPPPATSITYNAIYGFTPDTTNFVRAHLDFAGMVSYEYGHTEPLGVSTRYAYDGPSKGAMFPGENGVVQIVVPSEVGGKAGSTLRGVEVETQVGRTTVVPGAVTQSPSRGLSFENDTLGLGTVTLAPCSGGGAAPAPAPGGSAPAPAPAPAPTQQSAGPLPVSVLTKSVKAVKKGKRLSLKLRASEPVRDLGVRLSRGSKSFGTAKLGALSGTKTVRLKAGRALKKGTYIVDLVGTDGQGRRRLASAKLKVR